MSVDDIQTAMLIAQGILSLVVALAVLYWSRVLRRHVNSRRLHNQRPQAEYWRPEYPSDELPESGPIVEESTTYPDMHWTREENE